MSRLVIEHNYLMQMGMYLDKFKYTPSTKVANFRCPICGDSQKNSNKCRGFIFLDKKKLDRYKYKCHNCGANQSFLYFLKEYYPSLFQMAQLELLKDSASNTNTFIQEKQTPIVIKKIIDKTALPSVLNLEDNHPAKLYCMSRMIPHYKLGRILYTNNLREYVNKLFPNKYEKIPEDERIVFPLKDKNDNFIGIQARVIDKNNKNHRFVTLKFIDELPKLYGLHAVNTNLPIIVTEGIIDSLFLDNSIALSGGDVLSDLDNILNVSKDNIFIVLDNEPRSKDTVNRMKKAIESGYKVYFWNVDTKYKDINEMVKNNIDIKKIQQDIYDNSLSGMKALIKFNTWKKI